MLARSTIGLRSSRENVGAVLLDMFGTLVELEAPSPRLRSRLVELADVDVGEEAAARGFAAEIGHYLANHMKGRDQAALEALRDDCAAVLHAALGHPEIERAAVRQAMLDALALRVFDDVAPALRALRGQGVRLVVVSNWDCSLPEWLELTGLAELVDGVVSSAVVGAAKPSPEIFRAALERAGVREVEAVHVGDSVAHDVKGARAAGVRPVLIARRGGAPEGAVPIARRGGGPDGVEVVSSLAELSSLTR